MTARKKLGKLTVWRGGKECFIDGSVIELDLETLVEKLAKREYRLHWRGEQRPQPFSETAKFWRRDARRFLAFIEREVRNA